ncbi:MAG TPA: zf-HC2 domain-containing protein [Roseiflexaceae bacterium]|nr:zf-HC2 domain-containing protein [Roseiflexaceae bacterium]
MRCYDEGALRAYLDDALPAAEHAAVGAHLSGCASCRARLRQQHTLAAQVGVLLAAPADMPDPQLVLAHLRATTNHQRPTTNNPPTTPVRPAQRGRLEQLIPWRHTMQTSRTSSPGMRRGLFGGLAALVMLVSLLALPPVRAAADQLLQVFRVQKILFVPISPERIEQLKQLNFDGGTLFVDKPKLTNQPADPRPAASADEAAAAAGFPVAQPTAFPGAPTSTEHIIHDRVGMQFQVNVEAARQLLGLLNIDDVTLPDSLGTQPITADVPGYLETRYRGDGYELTLYQGRTPSVTLPDGLDLPKLGKAGLQLLGIDEAQAETMSQQIDWNSTLIFPFPSDIQNIRQVQLGDAQALLVRGGRNENHWQLYWQSGERFFMLHGEGRINDTEIIAVADSVR